MVNWFGISVGPEFNAQCMRKWWIRRNTVSPWWLFVGIDYRYVKYHVNAGSLRDSYPRNGGTFPEGNPEKIGG